MDLSHNFGELTKAMTDKTYLDMQRDAEKDNGEGKFRKLPPMMKNTITMFTMVPDMKQEELPEIKPTETFLSLLSMTSGKTARDTLHHIMKTKGYIVCPQDGMCAGIKNSTLQSTDIFDINGFDPLPLRSGTLWKATSDRVEGSTGGDGCSGQNDERRHCITYQKRVLYCQSFLGVCALCTFVA